MAEGRVTTGSPDLDQILGGGLERQMITQIYGESGSGKSSIVIMAMVAALQDGHHVLFFDTEGFSMDRFIQVAGGEEAAALLATRIRLYEPKTFAEQGICIQESETILSDTEISLIVMDSATALYRSDLERRGDAQRMLGRQMIDLLALSRRYNAAVLITNQVYTEPATGRFFGLGGTALSHISKAVVSIERINRHRRAVLVKHRSRPEGESFDFVITGRGIGRC
ncbi:MAG: DNA repair and recombination protein RadB [Methanocalculus sp. MSAO_Arc1]|uniref:DNA repair and recombination protein RadB n=1 Tax=Methanocalculus TaxID=71151 RepID=UPI000FF355EF|nr:DNA repair and recombination protein RadB [Methanocalculus sp. MSAO_Arc1]MCP1662717.1 DNA repair protein RadB [Methanocalculus sp. AMF5]RQD79971.1 MAG: DNA repair and recombination protein RadB [Methanocalculus sp. MSAO_Arc1]